MSDPFDCVGVVYVFGYIIQIIYCQNQKYA